MVTRYLASFFLLFISLLTVSLGQDPTISQTDCANKAAGYADTFAIHLQRNEVEKMDEVLLAWEQDCGVTEPIFRAKAIYLLMTEKTLGELNDLNLLDFAIAFDVRYNLIEQDDENLRQEYFGLFSEYFGHVPINNNFDRQTRRAATILRNTFSTNDLAFAWLTLYSGNTRDFFMMLKDGAYAEFDLANEYKSRVAMFQKMPELFFGVTSGLWIPDGDLIIIGLKPTLGVFFGVKSGLTTLTGNFEMRFGKTKTPFQMMVKDTIIETRNHQGGYLGLEINQAFWRKQNFELGIFAAAGYNIIDMVESGQDPQRQTFGSWAFHAGPYIELILPNRTRLGMKPGFSWLNHNHPQGSSLSGNAYTLRLYFGIAENARKTQNLKRLGY